MTNTLIGKNLSVVFGSQTVLSKLSIELTAGRFVGLIGPSGCGKTTLARVLSGKLAPTTGEVHIGNTPIEYSSRHRNTAIATIHQSPRSACNPTWTLRRIITEPLALKKQQHLDADLATLTAEANIPTELLDRRPNEVSDGQLQRACIARALAQQARFLICDEPTSMLDPLVTANIIQLLRSQAENQVGVLFISHNHRLLTACADQVFSIADLQDES